MREVEFRGYGGECGDCGGGVDVGVEGQGGVEGERGGGLEGWRLRLVLDGAWACVGSLCCISDGLWCLFGSWLLHSMVLLGLLVCLVSLVRLRYGFSSWFWAYGG